MSTWEDERKRIAEVGRIFDADAGKLQMEILLDEGVHRHVRFARPGTALHRFDLVTWPGSLSIGGDVESFVFTREDDMFGFFGGDRGLINPSYWAEKCRAGRERLKSYDEGLARRIVLDHFTESVKYGGVPRGTGRAIREWILTDEDFAHEEGARRLLENFQHDEIYVGRCTHCRRSTREDDYGKVAEWIRAHEIENPAHIGGVVPRPAFAFSDTWEWDLTSWNHHFLYACHAITWGIGRYIEYKTRPKGVWARWRRRV